MFNDVIITDVIRPLHFSEDPRDFILVMERDMTSSDLFHYVINKKKHISEKIIKSIFRDVRNDVINNFLVIYDVIDSRSDL